MRDFEANELINNYRNALIIKEKLNINTIIDDEFYAAVNNLDRAWYEIFNILTKGKSNYQQYKSI